MKASELNSASDYSIYEGMRLKGRPVMTVSRGRLVMDHGEICAEPGTGRYVKKNMTLPPAVPQQGKVPDNPHFSKESFL